MEAQVQGQMAQFINPIQFNSVTQKAENKSVSDTPCHQTMWRNALPSQRKWRHLVCSGGVTYFCRLDSVTAAQLDTSNTSNNPNPSSGLGLMNIEWNTVKDIHDMVGGGFQGSERSQPRVWHAWRYTAVL